MSSGPSVVRISEPDDAREGVLRELKSDARSAIWNNDGDTAFLEDPSGDIADRRAA